MGAASGNGPPVFLSAPLSRHRIQALNALVPKMMPLHEKARP